ASVHLRSLKTQEVAPARAPRSLMIAGRAPSRAEHDPASGAHTPTIPEGAVRGRSGRGVAAGMSAAGPSSAADCGGGLSAAGSVGGAGAVAGKDTRAIKRGVGADGRRTSTAVGVTK